MTAERAAGPHCSEGLLVMSQGDSHVHLREHILGSGPEDSCKQDRSVGAVPGRRPSVPTAGWEAACAPSLQTSVLSHLQVLPMQLLLGFVELPQLLGQPLAQLLARGVMSGQAVFIKLGVFVTF